MVAKRRRSRNRGFDDLAVLENRLRRQNQAPTLEDTAGVLHSPPPTPHPNLRSSARAFDELAEEYPEIRVRAPATDPAQQPFGPRRLQQNLGPIAHLNSSLPPLLIDSFYLNI